MKKGIIRDVSERDLTKAGACKKGAIAVVDYINNLKTKEGGNAK